MLHKLYIRLKEWLGASEAGEDKSQPDPQVVSNLPQSEPTLPVEAPASSPPSTGSDDRPLSDLEKLLAEEGIDLNSVAEERPEAAQGMSAKEWLISTSDDELIRKQLDEDK